MSECCHGDRSDKRGMLTNYDGIMWRNVETSHNVNIYPEKTPVTGLATNRKQQILHLNGQSNFCSTLQLRGLNNLCLGLFISEWAEWKPWWLLTAKKKGDHPFQNEPSHNSLQQQFFRLTWQCGGFFPSTTVWLRFMSTLKACHFLLQHELICCVVFVFKSWQLVGHLQLLHIDQYVCMSPRGDLLRKHVLFV